LPGEGSFEPKHVAVCEVALKCLCWTAYILLFMI